MPSTFVYIILFSIATAVSVAARRMKVPYTVALVLAGLAVGAAHLFDAPHLTHEMLFDLVLPGLIFEAAFHLDFRRFWADRLAVFSLAVPGLIAAIFITASLLAPLAGALALAPGFNFIQALVFASLIAATDPIAVVALFKSLGVPKRLAVLVEGESLLNDGTGVVLFSLVLGVATQGRFTLAAATLDFFRIAGLGALIGATVGYGVSLLIGQIDDPMVELTLTIIAAYGSFALAETLQVSGVMANVAAGLICGNYAANVGMSTSTLVAVETAWEFFAFALNSIVFLLIGLEVQPAMLLADWKAIVAAYAAVMLARTAVVLLQGLTVGPLLRLLGVERVTRPDDPPDLDGHHVRAAGAALETVRQMRALHKPVAGTPRKPRRAKK
jgi:CPA1 family monovalent cation:H+ antiporter